MRKLKSKIIFVLLLLFLIIWTFVIYNFSPERIINSIGIENSYFVVFIISLFGGISILFPIPYYIFVMTFAAGGSNPLLLGIFAGVGLTLGDSTSYLFGRHGGKIIPNRYNKISKNILNRLVSYPEWLRASIILLWGSIVPLPSDVLTIPLGLMGYSYKKLIIPLGIGHIIFNTLIAFAGYYGISFILQLLLS